MQCGGSAHEGFSLEYQEYSVDGHWELDSKNEVDLQLVTQAILAFANDDESWRTLPWKRVSLEELGRRSDRAQAKLLAMREAEAANLAPKEISIWEKLKSYESGILDTLEEIGLISKRKRNRR
jgi:hypothetical protein